MTLAQAISAYNRSKKWEIFRKHFSPHARMRVLDVGFTGTEYSPNDNYIEKHYPYPERLTALGIEDPQRFKRTYAPVNVVLYGGTEFPFADQAFDVCWSNAVLEHVGGHDNQVRFLREIARVSKRAFVTTPNRLFPVEVHTRTPLLHYLPRSLFDSYLTLVGKKWAAGNYMNLLSRSTLKQLLKRSGIADFTIIANKLVGITLEFLLIIR